MCRASIARERTADKKSLVDRITSGRLNYLVNNSGLNYYAPLLDTEIERVRATFETNVIAHLRTTKAFFPLLRAAGGVIVNNASSAGVDSSYLPFGGVYNSSKSAAAKLSQTLRLELAPFGVRVNHALRWRRVVAYLGQSGTTGPRRTEARVAVPSD